MTQQGKNKLHKRATLVIKALAQPSNNAKQLCGQRKWGKQFTKLCDALQEICGFHSFNLSSFVLCFNETILLLQNIKICYLKYVEICKPLSKSRWTATNWKRSIVDLTFRITICRFLLAIVSRSWDLVGINLSFVSRDFVCLRMSSICIALFGIVHQRGHHAFKESRCVSLAHGPPWLFLLSRHRKAFLLLLIRSLL